jgi:hypothetical protein
MDKIQLANGNSLDVYRRLTLKQEAGKTLREQLDPICNSDYDNADEIVYQQGQDTYIAVGRGDLRGLKAGDEVEVAGEKRKVLYVNNKLNTNAEAGKRALLTAMIPGGVIGACGAALGALTVGGPLAIGIGAVSLFALGTLCIWAQMASGLSGRPDTVWNDVRG